MALRIFFGVIREDDSVPGAPITWYYVTFKAATWEKLLQPTGKQCFPNTCIAPFSEEVFILLWQNSRVTQWNTEKKNKLFLAVMFCKLPWFLQSTHPFCHCCCCCCCCCFQQGSTEKNDLTAPGLTESTALQPWQVQHEVVLSRWSLASADLEWQWSVVLHNRLW